MKISTKNMPLPLVIPVLALVAGCSTPMKLPVLPSLMPYKMDIQQGNVVTQDMIAKIQPGMTRSQVRFALGTPLVVDPFRTDRWDYVYQFQKAGTLVEHRRIVVIFKDDKLVRIDGDVVPAGAGTATPGGVPPDKTRPAAPAAKPPAAATQPGSQAVPPSAQPGGASVVTSTGERVGGVDSGKENKAKDDKAKEPNPLEQRGFFGRMLDRMGF